MNSTERIQQAIVKLLNDCGVCTANEIRRGIYLQSKLCIPDKRVRTVLADMVAQGKLIDANSGKGSWYKYVLPFQAQRA